MADVDIFTEGEKCNIIIREDNQALYANLAQSSHILLVRLGPTNARPKTIVSPLHVSNFHNIILQHQTEGILEASSDLHETGTTMLLDPSRGLLIESDVWAVRPDYKALALHSSLIKTEVLS